MKKIAKKKIRHIKYLTGLSNHDEEIKFLNYWQAQKISIPAMVDQTKELGRVVFDEESQKLRSLLQAANLAANNVLELTDSDLIKTYFYLRTELLKLKNVHNSMSIVYPKKSAFVTSIQVTYTDETTEIINEDINESLVSYYNRAISSMEEAVNILEYRIKQLGRIEFSNNEKSVESLTTINERLLFLFHSGIFEAIRDIVFNHPAGKKTSFFISQVLGEILGVSAGSVNVVISALGKPKNELPSGNANPYQEKAIANAKKALSKHGFLQGVSELIDYDPRKK